MAGESAADAGHDGRPGTIRLLRQVERARLNLVEQLVMLDRGPAEGRAPASFAVVLACLRLGLSRRAAASNHRAEAAARAAERPV